MSMFTGTQGLVLGGVGMLMGVVSGLMLQAWWGHRVARMKRKIPKRWPLVPRVVTNTHERLAWIWVKAAFFDHAVMVKMPVTRFTLPRNQEQAQHWYQLLSNAYCTFTVVDGSGRVVGCIDVANPQRNSKRSQILKQSLLEQCGIGYRVIDADQPPEAQEIRIEFMGDMTLQARASHKRTDSQVDVVSHQLRASLHRQRRTRHSDTAPLSEDSRLQSEFPSDHSDADSHILHSWQGNSFLSPLDSRKAELS